MQKKKMSAVKVLRLLYYDIENRTQTFKKNIN